MPKMTSQTPDESTINVWQDTQEATQDDDDDGDLVRMGHVEVENDETETDSLLTRPCDLRLS